MPSRIFNEHHDEPGCFDQVFLQFFKDSFAGRTPNLQNIGIAYMYGGKWVPTHARDGIAHVKNNAMGFVERSVETADLRTQGALERLALRDNVNIDAGCSNRSKIRSAQKCYPCLRYVVSPMCPGRTLCVWSGRADLNRGPPAPKVNSTTLSSCLVYVFRASCITV